ncbi:MAG: hypothetical protein ACP5LG_02800 [Conexivisphaera sp.]
MGRGPGACQDAGIRVKVGVGGPRIPLRAGYADVVGSGSVTVANASFIVPTVQPSRSSGSA